MAITTNVPSNNFEDLQRDVQDATRFTNATAPFTNRVGQSITPIPMRDSQLAAKVAEAASAVGALGWLPVDGSFTDGGTITARNQVLFNDADSSFYSWSGVLPKAVPAASTPVSTGGISGNAWVNRGDAALRSGLAAPDSTVLVGGVEAGKISSFVDSIKQLADEHKIDGKFYFVAGFYPESGLGGGVFQWQAGLAKTSHTGGTILDPDRVAAWNGTFANIATLYAAGSSGVGCFVKFDDNLTVDSFGAVPDAEGSLDPVLAKMESVGIKEIVANNRTYKTDNFIPATDSLSFSGNAFIKIKSGQTFNIKICEENKAANGEPIRMVYTDVDWDWGTCSYFKSLGFNTVMTFGEFDQANQLLLTRSVIAAKMNIMAYSNLSTASLPQLIDFYPNVIAYYIYDEPDASLTPIATQQARINSYRAVTAKPIATSLAVDSEMEQLASEDYDIVFVQHYYTEGVTATQYATGNIDRDNISKALHIQGSLQHKMPKSHLIPIVGLFTNANFTTNKNKLVGFARDVARLSTDGSLAVFAWGGATDPNNILSPKNDADLLDSMKNILQVPFSESRLVVTPVVFNSDNDFPAYGTLSAHPYLDANKTPLVKDVQLFSVNNVGSAIDEFNSTFHEQGLAARNAGGYALINLATNLTSGCVSAKITYRDEVDNNNATIGLSVTQNYGFNKTDVTSSIMTSGSSSYYFMSPAFIPSGINAYAVLFRFQPATSNTNYWKFAIGQIYISNWPDVSY